MTGEDLARHLLYALADHVHDAHLPRAKLWQESGVSDKKLARGVARRNMDLASFLSLVIASGYDPLEFMQAFPYKAEDDDE